MFDKRLRHAEHIRHYSITSSEESGWEVRLEEDDTLRRHTYYQDWHRVERAMAQFEREVTSERIRDKLAASKAKGMFMGGPVPLGYRVENRRLLVVPEDAALVLSFAKRTRTWRIEAFDDAWATLPFASTVAVPGGVLSHA